MVMKAMSSLLISDWLHVIILYHTRLAGLLTLECTILMGASRVLLW